MKKAVLVVFILIVFVNLNTKAQEKSQGFDQGTFMLGATIGQSYDVLYGFQAEYGVAQKFGIGLDFSYTQDVPIIIKYKLFGSLLTGAYHFMPQENFDPFIRAGVGYFKWSNDSLPFQESQVHKAGIGGVIQIGARYFFSDMFAGKVMLGYPYYFEIGLDIKLN